MFQTQEGLELQEQLEDVKESLQTSSNGPVSTMRKSLAHSVKIMETIEQFREDAIKDWLLIISVNTRFNNLIA